MRLALLQVVIVLGSALPAFAAEPEWRAGHAAINITPAKPLMMAGYAARNRPFDKIEDQLFAKALVLADANGNRAAIVTLDLIGLNATVTEPICARLREKIGLQREQIVINAAHIHTAPTIDLNEAARGFFTVQNAKDTAAYTRDLQDKLVDLVVRAAAKLTPARLSCGGGVAHFAMNRREFTTRGVRLGVNPRGPVDRSVPVLRIDGADGRARVVLFGYACHNTTLTQNDYMLSSDYAGAAQRFIETQVPGAQAMFVLGLAGDANPYPLGTVEIARQHGATLGTEVCRVLETKLQPVRGPLTCVFDRAALPVRPTPRDELERMLAKGNVREKETAKKMLAEIDRGEPMMKTYPAPLSVWQFGQDLTFVALSGEVVVDFVPLIEKAIGPLQLWVSAYSHDVSGYIPSARLLTEGGYETRGLYSANALFTAEAETVLVAKVRELAGKAGRAVPK
jgi:neutral ceramidase